ARALRNLSDMIQHLLTLARRVGAFLQPGLEVVLGAVQRRRAGVLLAMIHDGVSSGSLADLDRARPAARADELRRRADRQAVPGDAHLLLEEPLDIVRALHEAAEERHQRRRLGR